ncbi:cytochrome c-550 PedF [Aquabacterium sp.]|uniref:cytochrome c-550 PedF n=1 Tax=Aquabacterium sp. TaxID=1872578 RepID=UPI002B8F30D3|nr:cytochrome c-550 PedF [Aquabacterium sp.]HSW09132.1 cytochrome c-550 PedF [Aquabacterium sp.]
MPRTSLSSTRDHPHNGPHPGPHHRSRRTTAAWAARAGTALAALVLSAAAWSHGDVTPQAVDTAALPKLGETWRGENPFRGNEVAVRIGSSAYNQNCARCHGLEAISGGIAPDLRKLDDECASLKEGARRTACITEIDDYYATTVRRGRTRNGAVYMPPFEGVMNQEAVWAIKAYLETRRDKPLQAAQK